MPHHAGVRLCAAIAPRQGDQPDLDRLPARRHRRLVPDAVLLGRVGRTAIFLVGGVFPLLASPVLAIRLPEPVRFLLMRDRDLAQQHRPAQRSERGVLAIPLVKRLPGDGSKPFRAEPGPGAAAWLSPVGMTP